MTLDVFLASEIELDEPIRRRLTRALSTADAALDNALQTAGESHESLEIALREYIAGLCFEALRAFMATSASESSICSAWTSFYITALDQVFRERWRYKTWRIHAEWENFCSRTGEYIELRAEWKPFLFALRELRTTVLGQEAENPSIHDLFSIPSGAFGNKDLFEASWGSALLRVTADLEQYWSKAKWRSTGREFENLFGIFTLFCQSVSQSYLLSLLHAGKDRDTAVSATRASIMPALLISLTPPSPIPYKSIAPSRLANYPEINTLGVWEQVTAASWRNHCALCPADHSRTALWLVKYHWALRFQKKRLTFNRSMTCMMHVGLTRVLNLNNPALVKNTSDMDQPAYLIKPDPLYYFNRGYKEFVEGTRQRIAEALLDAHVHWVDSATGDFAGSVETMRNAFDTVATAFEATGLLSEDAVRNQIRQIIIEAGAAGGWRFPATYYKKFEFLDRLIGQVWSSDDELAKFDKALSGRTSKWRAQSTRLKRAELAVEGKAKKRGFAPDERDHLRVLDAVKIVGLEWRFQLALVCDHLSRAEAKFAFSSSSEPVHSWSELGSWLRKNPKSRLRSPLIKYISYRVQWAKREKPNQDLSR